MSHIYYLSDEDLLRYHPALRNGTMTDALIEREEARYTRLADKSCPANVITLGPNNGPNECRKRTPWTPTQFANLLREHITSSLLPRLKKTKKKRRVVHSDSDSDDAADSPPRRRVRPSSFVDDEASDGGEEGEEEEEDQDDADENGNLAGFVVPDHSSSSASTSHSTPSSHRSAASVSSPAVEVTGMRSRAERDAEGMANAIDLVTPPHA